VSVGSRGSVAPAAVGSVGHQALILSPHWLTARVIYAACHAMLCYAMLAMLCYAMLCLCGVVCYAVLCYACYDMLCLLCLL
jgi:hypothetical protein